MKRIGFLKSFGCALKGIATTIKRERNIKVQLSIAVVALALGGLLLRSSLEWVAIILCCCCVIAAELLNTAIEHVVDLVSPGWDELAGKAKDAAAGAVLVVSAAAAIVGLIVFVPAATKWIGSGTANAFRSCEKYFGSLESMEEVEPRTLAGLVTPFASPRGAAFLQAQVEGSGNRDMKRYETALICMFVVDEALDTIQMSDNARKEVAGIVHNRRVQSIANELAANGSTGLIREMAREHVEWLAGNADGSRR